MLLQSNDPQSFTIILIDFKIFKKIRQLISSGAVMVSVARCSVMQSPQKVSKISSFEPKIQRKSENQGYIKVNEKGAKQDIRKWVFWKSKFKSWPPSLYKQVSIINPSHCAIKELREALQGRGVWNHAIWSRLRRFQGVRRIQAGAWHTHSPPIVLISNQRGAHTAHGALGFARSAQRQSVQNMPKLPQIFGGAPLVAR